MRRGTTPPRPALTYSIRPSWSYLPSHSLNIRYSSVEVSSFEELQKYRQWTDDWCITVSEIAFEGFSLGGTYRFFLLMRDDFRRVPKKPAATFPNDSYGESILCVILNSDGSIFSVTNRWNAESEVNPEDYLKSLLGPEYRKIFE